jgi:hypothetical protein
LLIVVVSFGLIDGAERRGVAGFEVDEVTTLPAAEPTALAADLDGTGFCAISTFRFFQFYSPCACSNKFKKTFEIA